MKMYRQGDVLLIKLNEREFPTIPATHEPPDGERVVLAYGEVTGHAHAIPAPDAFTFTMPDAPNRRLLKVEHATKLQHEEHAPIPLEEGIYEVRRQREFDPFEERSVVD